MAPEACNNFKRGPGQLDQLSLSISKFNQVSSLAGPERGPLTYSLGYRCSAVSSLLQRDETISWPGVGVARQRRLKAEPERGATLSMKLKGGSDALRKVGGGSEVLHDT